MSWLFPGFLTALLAVGLPLALHLLRKRARRPVTFPSLRFLAASLPQNANRHRLRRRIVLALRCLALALLAFAFARPFVARAGRGGGRVVVVVLDNTFSLQAGTRWRDTLAWAKARIGALESGDRLGILVVAPRPTWLRTPSADTASALRALETATPSWDSARVEPALRLAAEVLSAMPAREREIVFGGDHQKVGWFGTDFARPLAAGVSVSFADVPPSLARQAALTPPSLERSDAGLRARLSVRNYTGAHQRHLRVTRLGSTAPLVEQAVDLGDHETRSLEIDLAGAISGTAGFRFALDADDLPADDVAYAAWRGAGGRRVLLDAAPDRGAADFLKTALESTTDLKPALQVSPTPPNAPWPSDAVALLRNDASFTGDAAERLDAFLLAGGSAVVFIGGGPAQSRWLIGRGLAARAMTADEQGLRVHNWTLDHPLVTAFSQSTVRLLVGWRFREGWGLAADAVNPLALWTPEAIAIGETDAGHGRLLLCGFSPDRRASEWPVQGTFVPFIHRAVVYLFGASESGETAAARVGTAFSLPGAGSWRALDGPASAAPPVAVTGSVVPDAPGLYELTVGTERHLFPVHLSADESDPAAWEPGTPWTDLVATRALAPGKTRTVTLGAVESEQQGRLWWWLLGVAAVALALELPVANRTSR
jgi:hypothetical protein